MKYFTADDGQIVLGEGKRYIVIGTLEASISLYSTLEKNVCFRYI